MRLVLDRFDRSLGVILFVRQWWKDDGRSPAMEEFCRQTSIVSEISAVRRANFRYVSIEAALGSRHCFRNIAYTTTIPVSYSLSSMTLR